MIAWIPGLELSRGPCSPFSSPFSNMMEWTQLFLSATFKTLGRLLPLCWSQGSPFLLWSLLCLKQDARLTPCHPLSFCPQPSLPSSMDTSLRCPWTENWQGRINCLLSLQATPAWLSRSPSLSLAPFLSPPLGTSFLPWVLSKPFAW